MSDPIEDLKKKKLEEMMRNQQDSQNSQNAERKQLLSKLLTAGARERINNLKMTKPQVSAQLEEHLVQLYKTGQIKPLVTEEQIIKILDLLLPKRSFRISRR